MLSVFEKDIFKFFHKLLSDEVETVFWESVQNYLDQNLIIRNFLEIGFGVTLTSNRNVLCI